VQSGVLKYNGMLLVTAILWGSAFVFQREGADVLQPFLFGAIRYALGACFVMPLLVWQKRKVCYADKTINLFTYKTILSGLLIGFFLFAGSTLQQAGLQYTTAGKAGFITESCVVIVPLLAFFVCVLILGWE